mmetsp:Transcript_12175/g.40425  ORF Transcript_12175/g.40425 Transcript_12175/m.40425 type:complete len:225 (-) Transcript_12175:1199-1873(-)
MDRTFTPAPKGAKRRARETPSTKKRAPRTVRFASGQKTSAGAWSGRIRAPRTGATSKRMRPGMGVMTRMRKWTTRKWTKLKLPRPCRRTTTTTTRTPPARTATAPISTPAPRGASQPAKGTRLTNTRAPLSGRFANGTKTSAGPRLGRIRAPLILATSLMRPTPGLNICPRDPRSTTKWKRPRRCQCTTTKRKPLSARSRRNPRRRLRLRNPNAMTLPLPAPCP